MFSITLLLVIVFCQCESLKTGLETVQHQNTNITQVKHLIVGYETNLNSSISLEKNDKDLRKLWTIDFQVKRISVTTKYRMQMTKHRDLSFQTSELDKKWSQCLYLQKRQIRKTTKDYNANESQCLTTTTFGDSEKTEAVEQLEKEIRNWRKGYRYLMKTCKYEHPDDEEATEQCLVEYMERDHYSKVIQRLMALKLEVMGQLYLHLNTTLGDLEECLKTQLFTFTEQVRNIMDALNKCYVLKL